MCLIGTPSVLMYGCWTGASSNLLAMNCQHRMHIALYICTCTLRALHLGLITEVTMGYGIS